MGKPIKIYGSILLKVAAQLSRCVEEVKFVVDSKPLLDDISCTLDVDHATWCHGFDIYTDFRS